jgi:hypothetical protein
MPELMIVVVKGPAAGRSFPLQVGHYRVIGRSIELMGGTAVVSQGERRRLEREDQRLMGEHLRRRAAPGGKAGARSEVASFVRDSDLDLNDEAVSQTHAMVFLDEAGASLVDVASTNGTYVNGNRVSDSELVVGDLIRVGETRIEIKVG